jgi:hypothetical protein
MAKTPLNMFNNMFIDNDLTLVVNSINEYNEADEEDEELIQIDSEEEVESEHN